MKLSFHLPATDPRWYQISVLSGLLLYGVLYLDFGVSPVQIALTLVTAQLFQYLAARTVRLPRFDPLSALISSLSLCLLLRTDSLWWLPVVVAVTILSKFVLRLRHKHIFNPVNFGLISGMLLSPHIWVSPGQWGHTAWFGFLLACLGGLVVNRAARSDVVVFFLLAYGAILAGRTLWLGDPWAIPWHQVQNGAFLLFTFFMISDPKTTPDSRIGRLVFALLTAATAGFVQFVLYQPNALLWGLVFACPWVPVLDWYWPGRRYGWRRS